MRLSILKYFEHPASLISILSYFLKRIVSHEVSNNPGKFLTLLLLQKVSSALNGYVILALRSRYFSLKHRVTARSDGITVAEGSQERF